MRHSSERTTRQTAVMPHLHLLWVCCDTPDAMTCHQTLVAPHEPHLNRPVSRGQSTGRDAENCSGSHQNFWSPQVSFGGGSPKTPPPKLPGCPGLALNTWESALGHGSPTFLGPWMTMQAIW